MTQTNRSTDRSAPAAVATANPLWQGGLTLDKVKLRFVEKLGLRLRPSTREKLADALKKDLRKQFGLRTWEHGRMLRRILLAINDGKRSMGGIRGHKGTDLTLRDVRENPRIEDLLPQIRTAHDLAALKDVMRDGDRRWELVIDAACDELETLAENRTPVSHQEAVDAMRRGMWVAFPESKLGRHDEKIDEVLRRALPPTKDGATGRLEDDSPITPELCDAFRKTVTRHLVVSHILQPFQELADDLVKYGRWPEAQIVERVLDGLTQELARRPGSDELRPVVADSLTRPQFKVLLELLGDEAFLHRIEVEVWVALAPDQAPPDRIVGDVRAALARNGVILAALKLREAPPDGIERRIALLPPENENRLEEWGDLLPQFQDWLNQRLNDLAPGLGQPLDQSNGIKRLVLNATERRSSKVEDLTAKEALAIVNRIRGWSGQQPVRRNELF